MRDLIIVVGSIAVTALINLAIIAGIVWFVITAIKWFS